jgi:methionyl-tRNA synthetase
MTGTGTGRTLLFTPPPTPNGPLHVGHLSGPYLAGDIAARAARADGRDVLTVCGLDSHQNYVLARAEGLGEPVEVVMDRFAGQIHTALSAARIEYDLFIDPYADQRYRSAVAGLVSELVAAKVIVVEPTTLMTCSSCARVLHHVRVSGACPTCGQGAGGGTCEGCGGFVTAADLVDAKSTCCAGTPVPKTFTIPVFRLDEYREQLLEIWSTAILPPRVRGLITRLLAGGLPDVPVAYPTDWGIGWTSPDGAALRVDVWVEMGLGYLFAVARTFDPDAFTLAECVSAWSGVGEIWHTLGMDNAFYYSTLIPALLVAAGMDSARLTGMLVNEFYRLDGLKFSTSRDHAIWAHEFLPGNDAGLVRTFLAYDRPDRTETDFRLANLAAFEHRPAGPALSAELAGIELDRAEQALTLAGFDPALAVRCALAARDAVPDRAGTVLSHIAGTVAR